MQTTNKALTSVVRSMKTALEKQHGIKVPHSALRAVLLQAQGENPHAFANKQHDRALRQLVEEAPRYFHPGYDFDGQKLAWLERAGLVSPTNPSAEVVVSTAEVKMLYIVQDEADCENKLAFDSDGRFFLPDFTFSRNSVILRMFTIGPSQKRYGLPAYHEAPSKFFEYYGIKLAATYTSAYGDQGDDTGDSATVELQVSPKDWIRLLEKTLEESPGFETEVAEWVGLHYGRNFSSQSAIEQIEWVERYLDSLNENC